MQGGSSENDNPDGLGEETTDPTSDGTDEPANETEQDGESVNVGDETATGDEGQAPTEGDQTEAPTEGDGSEGEQDSATDPEQDPAADSEQDSSTTSEPTVVDPWDWTGRTDNLVLSSESGLTFAEGAVPSTDAPLDATLSLNLSLDPSVEGTDVDDHTVVVPGDTLRVALPEGVTLAPDAKLDVFQLDEEGNPTTVRVAEATAEDDGATLVITFVEPTDTETGDLYYVGDPTEGTEPAAQTEGKTQLVAIDATLELPVTVGAELFGEEPVQLEWTLQTDVDDPAVTQTATLELPALPAEDAEQGETPEQGAEQEGEESAEENAAETEGASDENDSELAPIQLNTLTPFVNAEPQVSYELGNYTGSASMVVTWCDNNSADRPSIESMSEDFIPQFSLDGGETWNNLVESLPLVGGSRLTEIAKRELGITDDELDWATFATITRASVGDWDVRSTGLPTSRVTVTTTPRDDDEDGRQDTNDNGELLWNTSRSEPQEIQWRIYDKNGIKPPEGYVYGENDEGPDGAQRYLMRTQTYTFTIEGNLGSDTLPEWFGEQFGKDDHAGDFVFRATINGNLVTDEDGHPRTPTIAQMAEAGNLKVSWSDDNTAIITTTLPMYDIDGQPIVYSIQFNDHHEGAEGHDYFQPTYNNAGSANHGSATDAVYEDGIMTLRPVGTVSYGATKAWADAADTSQRKDVTFTLWRYSTADGSGPSTAAQVQLNAIDGEAEANAIEYVSVAAHPDDIGPDGTVDLGALLEKNYGDAIHNLPKYDPDGYPYIYALREDTSLAGYETVYGAVQDDGSVSDTGPNWEDINGDDQSRNRGTDDPFIYNGGTVTNRLTGNVPVAATKTWEIAAFQDSLQNVDVTFTAQSRKKATSEPGLLSWLTGGEEEVEWQDVKNEEGEVVTHTLEGFRSETLTQTFTESLPKYDAWGNELEYRWSETGVSINDEPVTFTRDGNGGGTFMLTLENSAGEQEELEFTSTLEVTTDLDTGESQSVVTNTFNNTTDQHVDKYWQQPDGTMQQVKPDPNGYPEYPNLDVSGNVTVTIFQNGEKYASFTMDGTTDGDPTFINDGATNPETDPYMQETRSYHADFQNLPKYDENGVLYSYLVLEEGVGGWHTTRTYDPETRTTRMENAVGPGYGSEIRIMKDWIDGADDSHRLDVVVQLVPLHDMQSAADPNKTYKAGEPIDVQAIENTDGSNWINSETDEITLSADNAWFIEAYVPVDDVQYDDFELVEVALVDEDGTRYPVASSATDAEDKYAELAADGFPMDWVNVGWDYQTTETTSRVATPDHVYQTYATQNGKGEYNDAMEAVVATNRRLGLVDLTVTKTWQDGVDPSRPEAELVVSCAEEDGVFHITNDQVWVQLEGGNAVPVTDAEGNTLIASENNITLEGNVRNDGTTQTGDTLVMTVDTPENETTSTYEFFGLPKYNGSGDVVHYDVTERWADGNNVGATGDAYTSSKTVQDVTYGEQHFHDQQQIDFTNTRTGSRDVTFYKNWNDGYVNGTLNQRPDIYLTLYRVTVSRGEGDTVVYSAPEQVPGYINYTWQGRDEDGSPEYNQSCTIEGLPAYDGEGNAYIYYAQETMSVADDGASLDYVPVTFDYDSITTTVQEGGEDEKDAVWVGDGDEPTDPELLPTADGRDWAIHENGTFVNSLTSDLVARGTKLWENVPVNVSQGDLPELTIYLQRKLPNEEWPALTFTKETADDGSVTWTPGKGQVVAWTSDLHMDANNQYSYQLGYEDLNELDENGELVEQGDATPLARYDEDGTLYEYRAIEVPWGLYGKDGGFDDTDLGIADGGNTTKDLTILHDDDPSNDQLGVVVIEHGETGSFQIRNRYDSPVQGNLTVQKHFTGREAGDRYPTTTFDVYRYYVNEDGVARAADLVASKTFTHTDIAGLVGDNANGNGSFSCTFEDLDVFAPDGSYWQYYVVERGINGYTGTVTVGELTTQGEQGKDLQSPGLCKTENKAVTDTVLANDDSVDVTFSNAYDEGTVDLSGTKTWVDYSNAFGVRPTAEEFKAGLTVTRIGNGDEKDITSEVASNLTVTDNNDGTYAISLTGMELWAPDGTAWRYRITENLSGMTIASTVSVADDTADDYYTGTKSSTVTAGTSQTFSLTNRFTGTAAVEKDWVDGNDPYGLRPESVTVRLQARVSGSDGSWQDADNFLKGYVDGGELPTDLSDAIADKTPSSDRDWKASWTGLPLHAVKSGNVDEIEYRVVEVTGNDTTPNDTTPTDPSTEGNGGDIYGNAVHPYTPTQSVDDVDGSDGYKSVITNTLEATSVKATKAWDDSDNPYGTRPTSGGSWQATFFLQRTTDPSDAESWGWVVEASSEANPSGSASQTGVVRFTITGNMTGDDNHDVVKNEDGSVTVTWNNLPSCDASGNTYSYRLVEQVPGSYDVEGAMQVEDDDTAHRYYVVGTTGSNPDSQSFTNDLRTTSLTGTKKWDDTEGSLIPEFSAENAPTMTLYRAPVIREDNEGNLSFGKTEKVTYQQNNGQPTWTDENKDGVWEFSYTGLPAANSSDQPYVYWAEEAAGSVDGFYPFYGTDNATKSSGADGTNVGTSATADQDGSQTNELITNVPTRLTLDKVSDFENDPVTLTNIELSVIGKDDGKTYAIWTNGESGSDENVKVWINGTTVTDSSADGYVKPTYTRVDGLIVGLGEGDYIVRETGNPPTGYAPAADVALHINADGTAKTGGAVTQTQTDGAYTIKVTVTDPVLRGHLQLTKRVSADGTFGAADATALSGVTFDLYRTDIDGDGKPELIASDLVTNGSGQITTRGNSAAINKWTSKAYDDEGNLVASPEERGATDLTYGGKYNTLANGLPEGTYYFVETSVPASAVTPDADDAKTDEVTIDQNDHLKTLTIEKGNEEFTAQVTLYKYDTATGAALDGAVFSVSYRPEGGTADQSLTDVTSGADGTVTFSDLKKGTYTVTERSNTGYDMTTPFSATFVIGNEDHEGKFDITSVDCADATDIGFKVTSGSYTDSVGIPNTPLTGSVTMTKTGMNGAALDGATFKLVSIASDGTETTVSGADALVTGNNYEMSNGTVSKDDGGTTGQITVSGLPWGTYQFVETEPAPGYVGVDGNGEPLRSRTVTISRANVSGGTISAGTVSNAPTSIELNKQNDAGGSLNGAIFEVTPVNGSKFADGTTDAMTLETEGTGLATLTGQLVVGGTYEIYEAHGPSGYDPVDATFQVKVQANGDLEVVGGDASLPAGWARADVDDDGQIDNQFSFIATNSYMDLELTKVSSSTGNALNGATFTLTGMCMDNNTSHELTTGEVTDPETGETRQGVALLSWGLMEGVDYTLTETTQPDGYIRMSEPLRFRMDDRGEIVVNGTVPEGWSIGEDGISLTAENDPVELQITKVSPGPDSKRLEGAVFSISPANGSRFANVSGNEIKLQTGTDGSLSLRSELIVGHTYDITEVSAPEGYELVTGTMRVKVGNNGEINVLGSVDENGDLISNSTAPDGYEKVADNSFEVKVTNQPIEIGIVKVSADDVATLLPDAIFELTGVFAGRADSETREFTTGSNGRIDLSAVLKSGEQYVLRETAAPNGFELVEGELTFEVKTDGTIAAVGTPPAGLGIDAGNNVTITAKDEPIEVTFEKADLNGDPISGTAEFTISGEFVDDATHTVSQQEITFTTTGDQKVELSGMTHEGDSYSLVAGKTYTVEETLAPSGYELVTPFSFTVGTEGTITAANGSVERADGEPGFAISDDGGTVTLAAYDRPIEVTLAKTDGSAPLSDATFSLYQGTSVEDGTLLADNVVTGQDGTVELTGLVGGQTYTLRETKAPAGYELVADVTFTVATDGSVTLEGEPEGWAVSDDAGAITLTATDVPIEARLMKTDAEGSPLAGAGFEVVPVAGSSFAGSFELNEGGVLELGPTDESGVAEVPAGVLVAGGTYRLTEVLAPGGYELAGTVEFTVGTDGSLTIVGSSEGAPLAGADGSGTYAASAEDGVAVITATDSLTELTVMKAAIDEDGEKTYLSGAEFTLTELLGRGTEAAEGADGSAAEPQVLTGTTDESGRVTWTGLKANTSYVLEETDAPAGFELLDDTLTIVVAPDGTVTAADGNASGAFTIGSDGVSVEVIDRHLGVSLVKTSLDGTGLAGGTFTLAPVEGTFPDGDTEKTFVSDEFGAVFTDLALTGSAEGTAYVLTEVTAPAGFETNDQITLLVYEDGTVGLGSDVTGELAERVAIVNDAADGVAVVTVSDVPIEASISKVSTEGGSLNGAEFEVTGLFANGDAPESRTVVVGEDGTAPIEGLVAGETYAIRETVAPEGFDLIEGTWSFTVATDGTLAPAEGSEAATEGAVGYRVADGGVTLVATDAPTPPVETPPVETPPVETPPVETPPDHPKLPDTSDATRPTLAVTMAASGIALLAAAMAHLRRERQKRS